MKNTDKPKFTSLYSTLVISNRVQAGIIAGLVVVLFFSIKNNTKPPIVIREGIDKISVVDNYQADSEVNRYDTELFIEHFVRHLNFLDSFSLEESLPRALNMMDD